LAPEVLGFKHVKLSTLRQRSQQILFETKTIIRSGPQIVILLMCVLLIIKSSLDLTEHGAVKQVDTAGNQVRDERLWLLYVMQNFVRFRSGNKAAKFVGLLTRNL
jgi:hypothetical protein